MGLGLGGPWGCGRWPSVPLGGGTGLRPPGPEGAQSAGRAGSQNGALGLCVGFQEEEGREEQISKAERWSSQGASLDHPAGDSAHHLLPGVFRPPSLDLWSDTDGVGWLEFGRRTWNLGFLRGMGAGRGGGELGAGCLGTEQEAGFLVSPPMGPAHLCLLPPSSFSHPNC